MNEISHTRKALEEVYRLADEKVLIVNDYLKTKERDYKNYRKEWDNTNADIDRYFNGLIKQLNKWKQIFIQLVAESFENHEEKFGSYKEELQGLCSKISVPHDRRKTSLSQTEANDTIFLIHKSLVKVEEVREACDDFMANNSLPLRFIGKFNLETLQRDDIGCVEFLADSSSAEILPINVARIKLGGLFNVKFRLSQWPCPAAKKHVVHKVTREDQRTGETVKVMSYLFDQRDGKYTLGFPITSIVPHTVSVEYMGQHIKNSPYTIVFKAGPTNVSGDTNNSCSSNLPSVFKADLTNVAGDANKCCSSNLPNDTSKNVLHNTLSPIPISKSIKEEISEDLQHLPISSTFNELSKDDIENCSQSSNQNRKPVLRSKFSCFAEKNASYESNKDTDETHLEKSKTHESLRESNRLNVESSLPQNSGTNQSRAGPSKGKSLVVRHNKIIALHKFVIKNNFRFPIGCGIGADNDTFICDTGHSLVYHYDVEFKVKACYGLGMKMYRPSKVVWHDEKNVLLVKDDREVYAFDPRTKKAAWTYDIKPKSKLYGLVISPDTQEIVTLEPDNARLIFLSPRTPKVQRTESYAPVLDLSPSARESSKCRFMDLNSNGDLVCSDLGLSSMYLTSLNGQKLRTFGCPGNDWGMFMEPSGVTCDQNGHVLIADSKHDRIQCFDDLGNFVCPLELSIRSRRPSDILLARDNRQLLVMNYLDHIVRVYSLEVA